MRKPVKNRNIPKPDLKYNSAQVGKLINYIMERGKRPVAQRVVYEAFDEIQKLEGKSPLEVFETALQNVGPIVEIRSRRIGGANYQIPTEVSPERRLILSLRWILNAAKAKKGSPMYERLAREIIEASRNEGAAVTQRENTQKMAEANRAFAHLAW